MERIFQNYEGSVVGLAGVEFGGARAVVDVSDGNVILIWLEDAIGGDWYRIFIDGTYCGIDRFPECEIEDDLDDGYTEADHSQWFEGRTVDRADVESTGAAGGGLISLVITFRSKATATIDCRVVDGRCDLRLNP
jgi:hypothetical protein